MIQQINQAGIAFHELHDERNDALQNFLEAHVTHHKATDFLEQAQLLFGTLKAYFKLSGFGHYLHYKSSKVQSNCAVM